MGLLEKTGPEGSGSVTLIQEEWRGTHPLLKACQNWSAFLLRITLYFTLSFVVIVAAKRTPQDRGQANSFTLTLFLIEHDVTQ